MNLLALFMQKMVLNNQRVECAFAFLLLTILVCSPTIHKCICLQPYSYVITLSCQTVSLCFTALSNEKSFPLLLINKKIHCL